jgi:hypothetical protein
MSEPVTHVSLSVYQIQALRSLIDQSLETLEKVSINDRDQIYVDVTKQKLTAARQVLDDVSL